MPDWSLGALVEAGRIHPSWVDALTPMAAEIAAIGVRLTAEPTFLPPAERVFRAFERPFDDVRVLIVGQDPYPTPGHSIGLAFAVDRGVKPLPRSLNNIDKELQADLGLPAAPHGDLSAWADQGVLLLNRVLTVAPGQPGSHRRWGWEQVTQQVIVALTKRSQPLVSILWGKDAEKLSFLVPAGATIISAHPSPLSASRGFFGSKPFSRANQLLVAQGATPINWARDTPEQHDAVALL